MKMLKRIHSHDQLFNRHPIRNATVMTGWFIATVVFLNMMVVHAHAQVVVPPQSKQKYPASVQPPSSYSSPRMLGIEPLEPPERFADSEESDPELRLLLLSELQKKGIPPDRLKGLPFQMLKEFIDPEALDQLERKKLERHGFDPLRQDFCGGSKEYQTSNCAGFLVWYTGFLDGLKVPYNLQDPQHLLNLFRKKGWASEGLDHLPLTMNLQSLSGTLVVWEGIYLGDPFYHVGMVINIRHDQDGQMIATVIQQPGIGKPPATNEVNLTNPGPFLDTGIYPIFYLPPGYPVTH